MKVFKFGGASVRHATAIRQVGNILKRFSGEPILVVVSAMGKTTNALERVAEALHRKQSPANEIEALVTYHLDVIAGLLPEQHPIANEVKNLLTGLPRWGEKSMTFDALYDQVVSTGELVSTRIVSAFLEAQDLPAKWVDARQYIASDNTYREGKVDWDATRKLCQSLPGLMNAGIVVTQGFIAKSKEGLTTTLGREGSDYTAAIFAACLGAESVTIWKDVPGVMNADPKRLPDAITFDELPFREAAEMTYYGASVIHPKTIKPLANQGIPLLVKNFDNPDLPGTKIHETKVDQLPPLIVFKDNQCLISCRVTDYTFIHEEQLSLIFAALSELDIRINLMQNSAISFSIVVDFREDKVLKLIQRLSSVFQVYYNTGLTLVTVKNYDALTFDAYRKKPGVLLEQSSRSTLQVLLKP
ncbi:MAG TPA: aspartate kinase [Cyclobacteriaceae bacterium]|nr:aspartate kinase [Cyclobacteriaceae bacterium]